MTPNGIAIFDFDRTLINQSSLIRTLTTLTGFLVFTVAGLASVCKIWRVTASGRREALRIEILRRTLAGVPMAALKAAAARMAPGLSWNPSVLERYHWHRAQGHRILIATGGLADYVPVLLQAAGIHADGLLGTRMETVADILTGEIDGIACTREEKARRAKDWIATQCGEHRCEIWGYGNLPSDGPMLALTDHAFVIKKRVMSDLK